MAWQISKPAGTDTISSSDQNIRDNWSAIETGLVPYDYLRLEAQGSDPSAVADHVLLYGKDVSSKCEVHWEDEDSNVVQMTSGGSLGSASTAVLASSINFGGSSLATYVGPTSWTPTLTCDTPGTLSVGYSIQVGWYQRIGDIAWFYGMINLNSFTQGTASGDIIISGFPLTFYNNGNSNRDQICTCELQQVDINASAVSVNGTPKNGTSSIKIQEYFDNANRQQVQIGDISSNSVITVQGFTRI